MVFGVLAVDDLNPFVTTREEAIASFVQGTYISSSDAYSDAWGSTNPTLATTYKALYCLYTLGATVDLDTQDISNWIDDHRNDTAGSTRGGYGNDTGSARNQPDMYSTVYAVLGLSYVSPLTGADLTYTVSFIESLHSSGQGYVLRASSTPTLSSTYLALRALESLNDLSGIENVSEWINQTQVIDPGSDGFGSFTTNSTLEIYSLYSSLEAIGGLGHAGESPIVLQNETAAINWIGSCQNLDNGFSDTPTDSQSQMASTKAAVLSLKKFTTLSDNFKLSVATWVLSCQKQTYGGFSSSPNSPVSSVSATYDAMVILNALGLSSFLKSQVPWENVANPFSIVFIIVIIVAVVGIAALVVYLRFIK